VDHLDIAIEPPRIGRAPHRVGAELKSLATRAGKLVERKPWPQHQRISRRIARQGRADHEPGRILIARHVLERMHRGVKFSGQHRLAYLRDKSAALAAMRQQLAGLVDITRRLELDDLDGDAGNS
jgi:hypothetical protein